MAWRVVIKTTEPEANVKYRKISKLGETPQRSWTFEQIKCKSKIDQNSIKDVEKYFKIGQNSLKIIENEV